MPHKSDATAHLVKMYPLLMWMDKPRVKPRDHLQPADQGEDEMYRHLCAVRLPSCITASSELFSTTTYSDAGCCDEPIFSRAFGGLQPFLPAAFPAGNFSPTRLFRPVSHVPDAVKEQPQQ